MNGPVHAGSWLLRNTRKTDTGAYAPASHSRRRLAKIEVLSTEQSGPHADRWFYPACRLPHVLPMVRTRASDARLSCEAATKTELKWCSNCSNEAMQHIGIALALALVPQLGQATVITQGSLHASYETFSDGYTVNRFRITLIGEGLNVSMGLGGPFAPLNIGHQSYCGTPNQLCGPYDLASTFNTPDLGTLVQQSVLRVPTATVGGVTFTNAYLMLTGNIQGPTGLSAMTTCDPCPNVGPGGFYMGGDLMTVWGPFPFTLSGTVTVYTFESPNGPQVLAQDSFSASGSGLASQINNRTSETQTTDLTFTPEPASGTAMLAALAAVGAFGARRRAKRLNSPS